MCSPLGLDRFVFEEAVPVDEKEGGAVKVDEMDDGDKMNPCAADARSAGAANLKARCIFLFREPRIALSTYLA